MHAALEQRQYRPGSTSAPCAEAQDDPGPDSLDTGNVSRPSNPHAAQLGGVPRRHASELSYDDFVLQYMAQNLPVMIQVSTNGAQWP